MVWPMVPTWPMVYSMLVICMAGPAGERIHTETLALVATVFTRILTACIRIHPHPLGLSGATLASVGTNF